MIKNKLFFMIFCALSMSHFASAQQAETNPSLLQLWYNKPASKWTEALPVGNGRIGAMVFGGADTAQFQLNDATLWSGYPHDWNNPEAKKALPVIRKALFAGEYQKADQLAKQMMGPYVATYLTLGNLFLYFEHNKAPIQNYKRSLNLEKAVIKTSYEKGKIHYTRKIFSSYPDQILVVHLKADRPGSISFTTHFENPMPHHVRAENKNTILLEGMAPSYVAHRPYDKRQIVYDSSKSMRFTIMLKAVSKDGEIASKDSSLSIKNASEVTLFISTGTGFRGFNKMPDTTGKIAAREVFNNIKKASEKPFEQLLNRHKKDYRNLFKRVYLNLGTDSSIYLPTDIRLEKYPKTLGNNDSQLITLLFQYGRYLLIASSRPAFKGSLFYGRPANLKGIWNDKMQPPWSSNYTTNINTEMNYWPAEKDNLSECAAPLFHFIKELSVNGAVTAKVNYGANGWVSHHNSDLWAQTAPPGNYGKDPMANPQWAIWPMSGAWFCRHLWEHYLFNGDKKFLKDMAYPVMKGSAEFMLNWLIPYHGYLVTAPSTSPEHSFVVNGKSAAVSIASTMDMSIIRDLFFNTISASKILDSDKKFRASLEAAYRKLYPFHIGQYGQLQEWFKDWDKPDDHHRHISHLYGLYPANLISPRRTPLLAAAVKKSLEQRGDGGTGWSKAWKINCWAKLEDGNHAFKLLRSQLQPVNLFPNLFDAINGRTGPFQIDGNFGFTSGVTEMLLQSQDGNIYLLPALPDVWKEGSVGGLKARGGFLIQNLSWENGRLKQAKILSKIGGICRIRTTVPVKVRGAKSHAVQEKEPVKSPYFQTPPVENIKIKDLSEVEKLPLKKTYLTEIYSKKGADFEILPLE